MAATRIIPMLIGKGKTIAQSIKDRTDYAKNPDKTEGGELVTGYECDPATVDAEFLLTKKQYHAKTGRMQDKESDVLAYHIRQAFKPGEITPEEANRIGYELALRWTKGKHQFIVCTHTDRDHIHNHIIYSAVAVDGKRKFRNFWNSTKAVRRLSDRLCLENGLSVIENPKPSKGHYGKWLGDGKPKSWQDKLRAAIDAALAQKPADFDAFLKLMEAAGYEYKPGKYLAFRTAGQKNFTRCRASTLGEDYTEAAIRESIGGKRVRSVSSRSNAPARKVNLLIDIQAKIQAGKGAGYERWAKVFNLKQAAQTLAYLSENGLLEYAQLEEKAAASTARFNQLSGQIKQAETRMSEITALKKQIYNYAKTRQVYIDYRKAGYSKKFYAAHETEIRLHKAAKEAFSALNLEKLPTVKTLQAEYEQLLSEKKKAYQEYQQAKKEMQEVLTAKANVDRLLGGPEPAKPDRENER